MLLRSLLPSWKFFENIGGTPILFFRTFLETEEADGWSDWQVFHQDIPRRFWHLLFNPDLNLQLAEKSALQHVVRDLTEEESENPVSLEIIENLVRGRFRPGSKKFQFKIAISDQGSLEDVFISDPKSSEDCSISDVRE